MKLRTAIVGLGPHGMRMVKASQNIDAIEWVAVVDRDTEKLNQQEITDLGVEKLTNLEELWQHNIELLLIATNGPSHAPIALEGIKNGITHLLVSKPYTCSLEEAITLNEAVKKNNIRLVVDHLIPYEYTYQWLRQQIKEEVWGKLKSIKLQRPGIGLGCLGVHSFDLANFLNGQTPTAVSGWIDEPIKKNPRGEQFVDPGGLVVMEYANGVKAIVEQIEDGSGPQAVDIMFNHARIRVDEKYGELEVVEKDRNFVPGPGKKPTLTKTINPHISEKFGIDMIALLETMLKELVGNSNIQASGEAGKSAIEILVAAYKSNSNNHVSVALPLTEEADIKTFLPIT